MKRAVVRGFTVFALILAIAGAGLAPIVPAGAAQTHAATAMGNRAIDCPACAGQAAKSACVGWCLSAFAAIAGELCTQADWPARHGRAAATAALSGLLAPPIPGPPRRLYS